MIPLDFEYYRPDTVTGAVDLYRELAAAGKRPLYYAGGTEIITMARVHNPDTGAVIDIKGIPECRDLDFADGRLVIGAGVPLTRITEAKLWPLLAKAAGRIADHTTQGKITLGGNICGTIIYHEAVLPLFLTDSEAVVAGPDGQTQAPIGEIFRERCRLRGGDLLVRVLVDKDELHLPYAHVKRTKCEKIDYPLISLAAVRKDDAIRVALSGVCAFPFRSREVERALNERPRSTERRVREALDSLPAPMLDDVYGSAGYREFVLAITLRNTLATLEGRENA